LTFVEHRLDANPEAAARKIMAIASGIVPIRDGRIPAAKINGSFLSECKTSPAEYRAGMRFAVERGWLWMHDSGTFVRFTQAGAVLFA